MRISGSGIARNGMDSINKRRELWHAKSAISCLHDALLAVAQNKLTPEQVKDFFWNNDLERANFYGDVLSFTDTTEDTCQK